MEKNAVLSSQATHTIFICAVLIINGLGCSAGGGGGGGGNPYDAPPGTEPVRPILSSYPKKKVLGFVTNLY